MTNTKNKSKDPKRINGLSAKDLAQLPEVRKFLQNRARSFKTLIMRLWNFHKFAFEEYHMPIDELVKVLKEKANVDGDDVFQVLQNYVSFRDKERVEKISIIYYAKTFRKFLVRNGIEIPMEKFTDNVDLPKKVTRRWYDIKEDMISILTCPMTERLKTYLMVIAATSMRPKEPLHLKLEDFDFDSDPATVLVNGQFTKMSTDRKIYLTKECVKIIQDWINFKHRRRKIVYNKNGVITSRIEQPEIYKSALLFGMRNHGYESNPDYMYTDLLKEFSEVRERLHLNQLENRSNPNYKRHKITFHSFRRRAKKAIEQKASHSYSEWFLGHAADPYWATENGEQEAIETFRQIEPYLTYLDVTSLTESKNALEAKQEALTKDLQKTRVATEERIEELEKQNKQNQETIQKMQEVLATLSNNGATIPLRNSDGKIDIYSPALIRPIGISTDFKPKYGRSEYSLTPSDTKIENELEDLVDELKEAKRIKDKRQVTKLESEIQLKEQQLARIKKEQKRWNATNI